VCVSATSACVGGAIVHISKMETWRAYLAQVARERLLRATRRPGRAWMPQVIGFDPRPRALCARKHGYGEVMSVNGGHRVCATFWSWWRWRGPKQHTNASNSRRQCKRALEWDAMVRVVVFSNSLASSLCVQHHQPRCLCRKSLRPTTADPPHAHCPCAAFFTRTHTDTHPCTPCGLAHGLREREHGALLVTTCSRATQERPAGRERVYQPAQ